MSRETSKAEKTRAFIIQSTAEVFNKKGFAGTSLTDLTEATGLTKGSIYGNFDNKEEVALAVFDYNCDRIRRMTADEVERVDRFRDKLLAYARVYRKYLRDNSNRGGCPILNTAIESDDTNPVMKEAVKKALLRWEKNLSRLLQGGIDAGEFRKETKVKQVAVTIIALIEGGVMISKATGDPQNMEFILHSLESIVDGILV